MLYRIIPFHSAFFSLCTIIVVPLLIKSSNITSTQNYTIENWPNWINKCRKNNRADLSKRQQKPKDKQKMKRNNETEQKNKPKQKNLSKYSMIASKRPRERLTAINYSLWQRRNEWNVPNPNITSKLETNAPCTTIFWKKMYEKRKRKWKKCFFFACTKSEAK